MAMDFHKPMVLHLCGDVLKAGFLFRLNSCQDDWLKMGQFSRSPSFRDSLLGQNEQKMSICLLNEMVLVSHKVPIALSKKKKPLNCPNHLNNRCFKASLHYFLLQSVPLRGYLHKGQWSPLHIWGLSLGHQLPEYCAGVEEKSQKSVWQLLITEK